MTGTLLLQSNGRRQKGTVQKVKNNSMAHKTSSNTKTVTAWFTKKYWTVKPPIITSNGCLDEFSVDSHDAFKASHDQRAVLNHSQKLDAVASAFWQIRVITTTTACDNSVLAIMWNLTMLTDLYADDLHGSAIRFRRSRWRHTSSEHIM